MQHLTVEQIAAAGTPLRTVRYRFAKWRRDGWPRVVQVPRTGPDGQPIGGVQWAVRVDDYDDLIHGRLRTTALDVADVQQLAA